jgi:hypothetical protein
MIIRLTTKVTVELKRTQNGSRKSAAVFGFGTSLFYRHAVLCQGTEVSLSAIIEVSLEYNFESKLNEVHGALCTVGIFFRKPSLINHEVTVPIAVTIRKCSAKT